MDSLSSGKDEGVFSHIEVSCISSTINDFFESGYVRCEIRDSVNVPLSLASGLKTKKRKKNHFMYREKKISLYVQGEKNINNWGLKTYDD